MAGFLKGLFAVGETVFALKDDVVENKVPETEQWELATVVEAEKKQFKVEFVGGETTCTRTSKQVAPMLLFHDGSWTGGRLMFVHRNDQCIVQLTVSLAKKPFTHVTISIANENGLGLDEPLFKFVPQFDLNFAAELKDSKSGQEKFVLPNRLLLKVDYFFSLPPVPSIEEFKKMEEEEESFAFDVSQSAVKEQVLMGQIVLFDVKTDRYVIEYTDSSGVKGAIWRKHDLASMVEKHGKCAEKVNDVWRLTRVVHYSSGGYFMTTSGYEHQEGDAFQIVAWHKPWIAMNVPPQRFDKRLSGSVCSLM